MNETLKLRGITTANNRFSFLLWNYPKQPYFLHCIKLNWWFKNEIERKYFSLSKIINKWINESIYEFGAYYFDFLEPKEVLYKEIERGKDLRDLLGIEVQVFYYRNQNQKRILKFRML
ncbi:hypothetical protein NLC29_02800 [Candidatus Aminicenantes bacterium AH-873-B07]|nr:hypothetical protein [Candidatus Aminicenantes bacterium AH-873-B07]